MSLLDASGIDSREVRDMTWDQRVIGVAGLIFGMVVWIALTVHEALLGED